MPSDQRPSLVGLAGVVVIALLATVPFLDKAFHIDDVLYLLGADQIRQSPWAPYGDKDETLVLWDALDGGPASLYQTDFNPPLWKYVLAGAIGIVGHDERKLHALSAVVTLLGAIGLYLIANRWTNRPVWCVAMILLSPFFLPGQNLMLEVPVLCLAAWGTFFHQRAWESGRTLDIALGGVFFGLAVLTKYSAGMLIPVFVVGSLLHRRPRVALSAVVSFGFVALWYAHNQWIYGEWHVSSHGVLFDPESWPIRALSVLRSVGSVAFLGPIILVALARLRGMLWVAGILAASIAVGAIDVLQARTFYQVNGMVILPIQAAHFWIFTSLGTATLLGMIALSLSQWLGAPSEWKEARTDRFLEFWILVMLLFNVTSTPFCAVRHLLLALVPLTWWTARQAAPLAPLMSRVALVVTIALGFSLAAADRELANFYRQLARENIRQDIAAGRRVWFTGNWGIHYYAAREGALPLFRGTEEHGLGRPHPGDRIYNPVLTSWLPFDDRNLVWTEHLQPESLIPTRTIVAGANYYSVQSYALPWSVLLLSPKPAEGRVGYQFPPIDHVRIFDVVKVNPETPP